MTDDRTAAPVVLVVEDEPLLRMMACDMVEDAGFEVVGAADADRAIAMLEQRPDIRVVFTDIDMPGTLDGMQLAERIRDRWPPIGIILTSGHTKPAVTDLPTHSVFYPKPYAHDRVVATMQAMTG